MSRRRRSRLILGGLVVVGCLVVIAVAMLVQPRRTHRASTPSTEGPPTTAPAVAKSVPAAEMGVSYDAFYFPMDVPAAKISSDLTYYQAQGVTAIYVSLSERDLADPAKMTTIIDTGHRLGLRVYANPYIGGTFSGDEGMSKQFYADQHPTSDQVSRLGVSNGHTPSINDPEYRDYLKQKIAGFAGYGFDGYEIDEPQIGDAGAIQKVGTDYFPYDHFSQALFKQQYGYDMPATENADTLEFRHTTMLGFIRDLVDYARQVKPGWTVALVLLPDLHNGDAGGTNNWKDYAALKNLDVFFIDPYWDHGVQRGWDWFMANIGSFTTATRGSHVRPGVWVQGYGLSGDYQDISKSLTYALDQGFRWLSVWVTDNAPNKDPAAGWAAIQSVYGQNHPSP